MDDERIDLTLEVNGTTRHVAGAWYFASLLSVLRDRIGLTGTKQACETGSCGACTVLLDGRPVNSCVILAADVSGSVTTIEGYSPADGSLTPLQEALITAGDVQCGYCMPGIVLAASAFVADHPNATEDEVREGMCGNLCRCTAYTGIIAGIQEASRR
ncbi:MAG: (2Fe-2S)-binding protein [bacterium]